MIGTIVFLSIYGLILLIWLTRHPRITQGARALVRLTRRSPQDLPNPAPLVSVLIPARNEAGTIRACVESILAQTYPHLEVIVADDRSTDGTAAIVADLARRDPRLRLVSVTELPDGWTGKTHALWQAAQQARGPFLLFVDADTLQEPENLAICMHRLLADQIDLLSLLPRMRNESFWEHVVQPLAGICLMVWFPLHRVNDPGHRAAFANGQYILIRRKTYEAVGGHQAVRGELLEDIALARRVKQAGGRLLVASATEISSTRMYTSLAEMIRGWARIYYAAADRRLVRLLRAVEMMLVFSLSAYVVLAWGLGRLVAGRSDCFTWTILAMAASHLVLKYAAMYRLYRLGASRVRYLPLYLLAALVVHAAQWLAVIQVFTRRVSWRGTAYVQGAPGASA